MNDATTTDISRFGWRERQLAAELLTASCAQGFPDEFEDDDVQIMFNTYSGNVFFTNSAGDVCMMNGDQLEMQWRTPYSGHEGFAEELADEVDETWDAEDIRFLLENEIISAERYQELTGINPDEDEEDAQ